MKKVLKYLSVFLLPILILNCVLIIKYGYEGFSNLLIVEDMHSQYASLISWFQSVLQGDNSLFYSFSKGIGGNMFSTFAYYLSSPLNLLLLFFDKSHYIDAIAVLINIKIGLASVSMYIFLKYKFKDMKFINLMMFSIIYALSGAIVNFYSNVMWIDVTYLMPLVIMGLDKLIHNVKSYQYIIFLAISIISNFYIGYILCIFCVMYFVYEMVITYTKQDKKVIIECIKKFILYSLLAGLISSIILIPMLMDMRNMFRYDLNKPIFYFDYKAIPMLFSKLFIGSIDIVTMFSHTEANVYISLFALILIISFFFNKKINKKEKITTVVVILIFILSILFNGLNLIWHGLSFPNGYNYRFVFCLSFFLIYISCKEFNLRKENIKFVFKTRYILYASILIGLSILLNHWYAYLSISKIIITLLFIVIYLIYYFIKKKHNNFVLLGLILIELSINVYFSFITKKSVNEFYIENYNANTIYNIQDFSNSLCSMMNNDNLNYRIDTRQLLSFNDGLVCSYGTINTALSTNHARYYEFLNKAGFSVTYSTIIDDFSNGPFIDSILGLSSIYKTERSYSPYYVYKDEYKIDVPYEKETSYIQYNNPYVLNLGYIVAKNSEIEFNNNAFEYQNQLAKQMSGLDLNIFEKVRTKKVNSNNKNTQVLSFYLDNKNYYIYNYVPTPINTTYYGKLEIDSDGVYDYSAGNNGIISLEEHIVGEEISVSYTPSEEYKDYVDLHIYSFNQENFEKVINKLKQSQLNVTKRSGNILEGNINILEDDSLLMITVPYEKGWNIYVDGNKVDYEEVYDTFIGIRLDKGNHDIKMIFYSPGIVIGSCVSIIGIGILIFYIIKKK